MINKGIESKAQEIKEINVQILENRGKILRLEDERQNKLKTLQDLQVKLSAIIEDASPQKTIQWNSDRKQRFILQEFGISYLSSKIEIYFSNLI